MDYPYRNIVRLLLDVVTYAFMLMYDVMLHIDRITTKQIQNIIKDVLYLQSIARIFLVNVHYKYPTNICVLQI